MINLALLRAFRRSPIDFPDLLVASGAGVEPLRVGPSACCVLNDPAQVWELLTVHARRTQKGRGLVRARLLLGDGLVTSEARRICASAAQAASTTTDRELPGIVRAGRAAGNDRWSDGG
jgi:hypothetical protein